MPQPAETQQVRVLIVEDHEMVRAGIHRILSEAEGIRVVGEAADGARAVELADRERPDVIVLDLRLPVMDGEVAMGKMLAGNPNARVLILTSLADPVLASRLLDSGAAGYMVKEEAPRSLPGAVRALASNREEKWLSPRLGR
jgi:DNA-binding NarL/FixJ family response regulator